jgi:hypothetical protein
MESKNNEDIFTKIGKLDPRIFYAILLVLMSYPMINPIGIPIPIAKTTQDFYNTVQSLPSDSVVLVSAGIGPTAYPELGPGLKAFMEQALVKDIKVVLWCSAPANPPMWEKLISTIDIPNDKEYGKDCVFLGYIPGFETAIAGLAQDIWAISPNDYYGTPIEDIPMMDNIRSADDIAVYYDVTMGTDTLEQALRQFNSPFGTPILLNTATGMIPATMPYYPNQVVGVLYGIRGGGEYELLVEKPWQGVAQTDVLSAVNSFVVIVILIGNVAYIGELMKKRESE